MRKESYSTEPTELDPRVCEKLVPPDHALRRVKQGLDFARCRDLRKDGARAALGRTAEDPVRRLKLACLPCPDPLAEREVVATAQVKVALRLFVDLWLASRVPGPSRLTQLRPRVGVARPQALFEHLVTPAREPGLVRERRRLKDATPGLAHLAVPSTLGLVAQTRQRLVEAARP